MNKLKKLILNVKSEYFEQIKNNTKDLLDGEMVEYRLFNDRWKKRLEGNTFSSIEIRLGYPRNDETEKIIEFKWNGYKITTINHEFFNGIQKVFAIYLSKNIIESR